MSFWTGLKITFFNRRNPVPGETWVHHWKKGNPWPQTGDTTEVIDVKSGFVKHRDYGKERVSTLENFKSNYTALD